MKKLRVPALLGKSCVACVTTAYLALFGLVLWLILEAELPLMAVKWHP